MDAADHKADQADAKARFDAQYNILMSCGHRKMIESRDSNKNNKMDVGNVSPLDPWTSGGGVGKGGNQDWN